MIKPEPTRTKNQAPRFYRQYIDENDSLSAAPSPVSSLLPPHLRTPSLPSSRNEAKDATGRAQPRRSLDIASKALGIKSLTLNSTDAVTQTTAPLLDARPTLTLHLPNGRVLPPLSPTASNFSPRVRSSSLGQTGSQHVGQASGTGHYRSASHTFSSPTTPIAILHPPRPPYCNASSGPLLFRNPVPSPVITIREPSPPPSESRSAVQTQTQSRKNSTDLGETATARLEQVPGGAAAFSGRVEKSVSAPDALASGDPLLRQSGSRPSLEDNTYSHDHTPDIAGRREVRQRETNAPNPCQETEEPMLDNISDKAPLSPPAHRSSFDSSNNQRSRGRSMELTRTKHVRRPRHRASTQPLQMADPMFISISGKEFSSQGNGGSSRSSLETSSRDRSLTLPGSLPQQPNDNTSTNSLQTTVRGSVPDTRSVAVTRLTSLNSHPPSSVIEREHTRSQSLDVNHHSGPPAVPRHIYASLPLPRIRLPSIHSKADASSAQATDSEATISHSAGPASSLPTGPRTPTHAVFPHPQPQPQPQSEAMFTSRASSLPVTTPPAFSSPAPNSHSALQSLSPHLEAHQPTTRLSLSKFTTQSLTTLRAVASASKIHSSSTSLSTPRSKSNSSSSSNSTASASTTSVLTPQSPPFRPPSPTDTSNLPLATLTQHMKTQLGQARHLLATLSHHLPPAENIWIHDTVSDAEGTVREILMLTEPLRVDREVNNGKLGLKTQLKWAVRGSWKAKDMRARLNLCYSSLVAILMRLQDYEAEYAESVAEHAAAKTETMTSDDRNPMTSTNVHVEGPTTSELESLHKYSAMQMEGLSLESVVDEHTGIETRSAGPQSPISTISREESIEPAPEKLDNELVDMLSWRWSQGREKTTQ